MNQELEPLVLQNNTSEQRFELEVDQHIAFISYEQQDDVLSLLHTESPAALAGRGVGSALVEKTLQYIKEHQLKLKPLCPFVGAFLKRHPQWQSLVV